MRDYNDSVNEETIRKLASELGLPLCEATMPFVAVYDLARKGALPKMLGIFHKRQGEMYEAHRALFGEDDARTFKASMDFALLCLLYYGMFEPGPKEDAVPEFENFLIEHIGRGIAVFAEQLLKETPADGNA
jgi:hypothetical protein